MDDVDELRNTLRAALGMEPALAWDDPRGPELGWRRTFDNDEKAYYKAKAQRENPAVITAKRNEGPVLVA